MADDIENDDQWLYGDNAENLPQESEGEQEKNGEEIDESVNAEEESDQEQSQTTEKPPVTEELPQESEEQAVEDEETADAEKQNGEGSDKEDYEEDSDDDINVVIGDIDIKTSSAYTSLNIKRGGLLTTSSKGEKGQSVPQSGKFTVEEFDQSGNINGVPVGEFNLDSLEDKPWRKPGADITDYFNYGFNEDTWRAYCERQKRMRVNESGTGLLPLNAIGMPRGPVPIMNDNSKYSGSYTGVRKAGPPPGRRMTGSIDVIGGAPTRIGAPISKVEPPKENVIQVMTADRREYSRKPGFPDMSVPPPTSNFEEFQPEFGFNPEPEPFYGGYEPTQDCQWGKYAGNAGPPDWHPQEIKTLTPASSGAVVPPLPSSIGHHSLNMPPPPVDSVIMPAPSSIKESSPSHRSKSKDREASVRRERDRSREREREKSHRYDRSRSRSHRHKSRSRSPSHRSHRKKKSKRHDDSE